MFQITCRQLSVFLVTLMALFAAPGARAQDTWVQIEARPSLSQAQERAAAYASQIARVAGFRLRSGWHAIALGPFTPLQAEAELLRLRRAGQIPRDAFIADGRAFRDQFWPPAGAPTSVVEIAPIAPEIAVPEPPEAADQSPREARAAERRLSREEREEVQEALAWQGVYSAAIDGDFGPGTRRAMGAWQAANNYETTGILTSLQRTGLVAAFRDARASLGLRPVTDAEAGIAFSLPSQMMEFAAYSAPFARYEATDGSDARLLLISQAGGRGELSSLYEVMQTLEIVPPDGPRRLNRESFVITGTNGKIASDTYAILTSDGVKGYTLVWPADDEGRRQLVLGALRSSFEPLAGTVLPDAPLGDGTDQQIDLLAGLKIRSPEASQSGFFVDRSGRLLTALGDLASCARIELGDGTETTIAARDDALGLALLEPATRLEPLRVASLRPGAPRLQSEISVSGYSYGGVLGAPTITYGVLSDVRGLNGEPALRRLELDALPGDAGGPVFDEAGQIIGLLQPNRPAGGRVLPEGVAFAAGSDALSRFLADAGVAVPASAAGATALDPVDLASQAADLTALVTCWAD